MLVVCDVKDFESVINGLRKSSHHIGFFHDLRFNSADRCIELRFIRGSLSISQTIELLDIIREIPEIINCVFDVSQAKKQITQIILDDYLKEIDRILNSRHEKFVLSASVPS